MHRKPSNCCAGSMKCGTAASRSPTSAPPVFSRIFPMIRVIPRLGLVLLSLALAYGCALNPVNPNAETKSSMAATQSLTLVGKPYRYGGNNPQGFDCSGLVQYSYSLAGVDLPHGTSHLRRPSRPISQNQMQRGDILFFNQEGKKSAHVALYLGDD